MLCDYCGKNEANIRYSENINGQKREMHLCEECSKKLGIMDKMDFHMTTDFPSFFGSFLENFGELEDMPLFNELKQSVCSNCNTSFDDIINTGKLGCPECYDVFSDRLDPILKRIQGANRHVGRISNIESSNKANIENSNNSNIEGKAEKEKSINDKRAKIKNSENDDSKNSGANLEKNVVAELESQLKEAIKDERYEDAAKIRDEIKTYEKKKTKKSNEKEQKNED